MDKTFLQQIQDWIASSRNSVIDINLSNYDLATRDYIKLLQHFADKPTNVSIIYAVLQEVVKRYQSEPGLANVPPLFFKIPGENQADYLFRCYESMDIPF